MNEQWLNDLKRKMEDYQEPAPAELWESLETSLAKQKPVPMIGMHKIIGWSLGAASVAALITLLFVFNHSKQLAYPTKEQLTENILIAHSYMTQEENFSGNNSSHKSISTALAKDAECMRHEVYSEKKSVPQQTQSLEKEQTQIKNSTTNINDISLPPTKDTAHIEKRNTMSREQKNKGYNPQREIYEQMHHTHNNKARAERLTASLYASNLKSEHHFHKGYGEFIGGATFQNQAWGDPTSDQRPANDIMYANLGKKTSTHKHHKQPIKAGISVRYAFNKWFSLETGLSYAYLGSSLQSGSDENHYDTQQALQYLGIPLNANFNVWKNKWFQFYISAGGMMEKCIAGKSTTDYIINNRIATTKQQSVMEKPLQFSLNGAIGGQINFTKILGLFVEPGINYYFNNGSNIETIYKDKPTNFNLRIGLRFSFTNKE